MSNSGIPPSNSNNNLNQTPRVRRSTRKPLDQSSQPKGNVSSQNSLQQGSSNASDAKSRLADGARSNVNRGGRQGDVSKPSSQNNDSKQPVINQQSPSNQLSNLAGKAHDDKKGGATKDALRSGADNQPDHKNRHDDNPFKENGSMDAPDSQKEATGSSMDGASNNAGSQKKEDGLLDKAKNYSSNATGVDYSDKSLKDQLEHQAADVAMDYVPGLGQANSARKALKNYNKAKKDAGGRDDELSDKAEEVMDKGVDTGIKATKIIGGAGMAATGTGAAAAGLLLLHMIMMLKSMVAAIVAKTLGFLGSILKAATSFITGMLGVTTAVANTIVAGGTALIMVAAGTIGVGVAQESKKDDSFAATCVPITTKVSSDTQEYVDGGEQSAEREANAIKLWSVYDKIGGSKEQTAAVLGNLQKESSLDPTAIETIYNEPFSIGARKQLAIGSDFNVRAIDPSYAARFPAIQRVGIGLAQWTNGRNSLLVNYSKKNNVNWFDFDTQVRFMLEGDDVTRQKQLADFLKGSPRNVQAETERFMNTWIGLSSPNPSLSDRQKYATGFMFTLERATADTNYADSILSGINVDRSSGNTAAGAFHEDDGCGNPVKSHYGNDKADGTGEVPAGLALVPWTRETLPESLKSFSKDPQDAGLSWGNSNGWTSGIIADQCAALAHSYFIQLYPDWNKGGKPTTRPFGDGKDVADLWAKHYGEKAVSYPKAGAVFSDATTSVYGHTGIVQHVFANGDILINEQNIRGASGAGAGISYSWSWRVIKKDRYESAKWKFFKPAGAEPQWNSKSV